VIGARGSNPHQALTRTEAMLRVELAILAHPTPLEHSSQAREYSDHSLS
jgi:hypothetical protein